MRVFKTVLFVLLVTLAVSAFAQTERPWWFMLEQGKRLFRSGEYGSALMAFEDARRGRLNHFTHMEDNFILFLSAQDLRSLGDSLESVEKYIADRRENGPAAVLAELYHRVPKDSLDNSVLRALSEIARLKAYPEAEYWLGESYRVEGELGLAFSQYEKAWETRALLETPAFETEILYKMTEIHRLRGEFQAMENKALEIIQGTEFSGFPRDLLWAGNAADRENASNLVRAAMMRILENQGVNRFLTLYRHDNTLVERAHRFLGFYYYSEGRYTNAAEHLMFAFLIQNTVIVSDIIRREFDFQFTTLENLESRAASIPALREFMEQTEYYGTVYRLSASLFANGKNRPANQLWAFLARSNRAGEWGSRAERYPSPFVDPVRERRPGS